MSTRGKGREGGRRGRGRGRKSAAAAAAAAKDQEDGENTIPSKSEKEGRGADKEPKDSGKGDSKPASFIKELPNMMYGFGDDQNPLEESVMLMQDIAFEFIRETTEKAAGVGSKPGKIQTEDLIFVIRKDKKKYARAIELLSSNEDIKRARKHFDTRL